MLYLVTGGAGFIGSHIVDCLTRRGHEVRILDDLSSGRFENIAPGKETVHFIRGSVTDSGAVAAACEGVDGIFHEAAIASVARSVANPGATHEVNGTGTLSLLIAARDAGVKRIVFASSSAVYGDSPQLPKQESMAPLPQSPYAVSKLAGEGYMRVFSELYGISTVSLRYFNVFGPRQDPASEYAAVIPKFITRILAGAPPVIFGDGTQTRDFIFVKDVAEANLAAMEHTPQGVYNIACGERIDLNTLAERIMTCTGIRVTPHHEPARPGDIHDSVADVAQAYRAFGFRPRHSLEAGLDETIRYFRTNQDGGRRLP